MILYYNAQIFPEIYQWSTNAICIILEKLFLYEEASVIHDPDHVSNPIVVEFTSALERALVYAMTGSGRALHRATMEPLLLSTGILTTGYPALVEDIWSRGPSYTGKYGVIASSWPCANIAKPLEPASSALNGLRYHLGNEAGLVGI